MKRQSNSHWSRWTTITLSGLGLGIIGILLQFAGNPSLFGGGFPPGVYFLLGAGLLVVATTRWRWGTIFGVLIAIWITIGGVVGGQLGKNISSGNIVVSAGAVVLQAGLALAIVAGSLAIIRNSGNSPKARAVTETRRRRVGL